MEYTPKALADAILASLDDKYDLIHVDYRDQFTDEQVAMIVRGDSDSLWDSTDEWESDRRYDAAKTVIAELAEQVAQQWRDEAPDDRYDAAIDEALADFEHSDESDDLRFAVYERETGDWARDLARQTPAVLLRMVALDEDHAFSHEPVSAVQVLARLGLPCDDAHNLATVGYAVDNVNPEHSSFMAFWIVGADVETMYDLMGVEPETPVHIHNPHLYLGNPLAGDGFITEEPVHATITVKRSDLHTDKDAFGYSVTELYGGLDPSSFEADIRAVTTATPGSTA